MKKYINTITGALIIGIVAFFLYVLAGYLFMFFFNIVANHFEFKTITFWVSFSIIFIISWISNIFNKESK